MSTQLLEAKDVAQVLGVSVRAVYRLTEARRLASIKIGRKVRIHPEDLTAFIESNRIEALDIEAEADTRCA